jgi:hypothetical protein
MTAEPFAGYEAAIERASWVRKGAAKVLFGRHAARSQFPQNFTSSLCADILLPKNCKAVLLLVKSCTSNFEKKFALKLFRRKLFKISVRFSLRLFSDLTFWDSF